METYYTIETEVEYRRCLREREAEADARAARARPENGRKCWRRLPHRILASLRARSAPRLPLPSLEKTTAQRRGVPNTLSLPEDAPA